MTLVGGVPLMVGGALGGGALGGGELGGGVLGGSLGGTGVTVSAKAGSDEVEMPSVTETTMPL